MTRIGEPLIYEYWEVCYTIVASKEEPRWCWLARQGKEYAWNVCSDPGADVLAFEVSNARICLRYMCEKIEDEVILEGIENWTMMTPSFK